MAVCEFASDRIDKSCFCETRREIRVVVGDRGVDKNEIVFVYLPEYTASKPFPWFQRRRHFSARVGDVVVIVDHTDCFVWILGAVWTVSSYVGITSLVCIGQIHEGCQFFWACLNHPGAGPNSNSIFNDNKLGEEWVVIDYFLLVLGCR
jgi:hypothetical protein